MSTTTVGPYATPEEIAALTAALQAEKEARIAGDAALAALIAGSTPSNVFHVKLTGSDSNPGTEAQPFRTIAYGCSRLGAGISLVIHGGDWLEAIVNPMGGESWERPARILAAPGAVPVLRPPKGAFRGIECSRATSSWLIFDGLTVHAGNVTYDGVKVTYSGTDPKNASHHIRFKRLDVGYTPNGQGFLFTLESSFIEVLESQAHHNGRNDLQHGIYVSARDVLVENTLLYQNYGHGIQFYSSAGKTAHRGRLRRSLVYENSLGGKVRAGVILSSGDDQVMEECEVFSNRAGLVIMQHATRAVVSQSKVRDNAGVGIQIDPGTMSAKLAYVECYRNTPNLSDQGTGTIFDHYSETVPPADEPA